MRNKILIAIVSIFFTLSAVAQSDPSTWIELEFSKKIVKNLKVEFNPELRLFGGFKMDTYILEGGLSYKLHDYLTLAGYYRYENEYNYRDGKDIYEWEPSNRFAFDAKTGYELARFNLQFRLRYTNGAEIDKATDNEYFRYRGKIDYDIKGSKIIPYVSVEAFHDLKLNYFDKMRYTGGIAYPLNNNNELSLFYRLQDYLEDPNPSNDELLEEKKESMNIIGIGYSLKF